MQKYTSMPGKIIQTCRKVVDFIHCKQIPLQCVKTTQELLSKLNEQSIIESDRSGGIMIIYEFLKASVNYYFVYNQNLTPANSISLMPIISEKKIIEFDESIEISKDSLNQSCREITPPKNKRKIHTEPKKQVLETSKIESRKSSKTKDAFEIAIEERFKEFLRPKTLLELITITSRMELIDEFEREIRNEIRIKFLPRVLEESIFKEELQKNKE